MSIIQAYQQALNQANQQKQNLEKLRKYTFYQIYQVTQQEKQQLDSSCAELLYKQKYTDQLLQKIVDNEQKLQKQAQNWSELIQKFNYALKALGDAGQIASVIANDLAEISKGI